MLDLNLLVCLDPVNCGDVMSPDLAGLIHDNPNLLNAVESASFSDGTPFSSLFPSNFFCCTKTFALMLIHLFVK